MKTKTETKVRGLARGIGQSLLAASIDMNRLYTLADNVSPYVMAHWIDVKTGEQGLSSLICRILRERGAEFPANVGETTNRKLALKAGLTAKEIIAEVKTRFAKDTKRHSAGSIYTFLSQIMSQTHVVRGVARPPVIASVKQSGEEDTSRHCNKPRLVWFVIQ